MEEKLTERLNFALSQVELQMLADLAEENAGNNNSLMLRKLITRAYEKPKALGLYAPKEDASIEDLALAMA